MDLPYKAMCIKKWLSVSLKIPFQRQAVSVPGTDADSFAYSAGGVASALISLPLKYMHTTVETVHKEDVENVIGNLIYSIVTSKAGSRFPLHQIETGKPYIRKDTAKVGSSAQWGSLLLYHQNTNKRKAQ